MSQYKISKKRLAEIIKEEYASLHELEDPRSPNPMSWEHEGAAEDFRTQIMNLVHQLGPLTLDPRTAEAAVVEIRDVLNHLSIGTAPGDQYRQEEAKKPDFLDLDKDGDEEESMEKAEKDKKTKKVKESLSSIRDLIQQELKNL